MAEDMISEKEKYIGKLENQIQTIEKILKMDVGTVVNAELKKKLRSIKTEADTVLRKLKNNEFEIAIVGLEKAGKSTFANALMENNLLPTKDLRCTFTSTRIEYSGDDEDDSATVSFYTEDEFNNDFKDKLRKLGIKNYNQYSFDTIDEKTYMEIYTSKVSDDMKRLYGDSIHEDILAIIRNVNSLSELLGRPPISFGADKINSGKLEEYITDESKARAVKEVVIRSKKLNEMKNAIIFDVPGFNSPTELHKTQTLERMKSADAIIVVANGVSPSLTGESLKILRESDDEGNPLNDKLFVFANKIEGARDIRKNINDTRDEWISKGFVKKENEHRIIFGSALAHLQAANLDSDSKKRVLRSFQEREQEMPNGDGVDAMRNILAKYNENERFEVLKRRINRINSDILHTFDDIRSGNENIGMGHIYSQEQMRNAMALVDDVRSKAKDKLLDLRKKIRSKMPAEQPLSKKIIQYITENVTTDKYGVTDEEIENARKETPYVGTHDDVGNIDSQIRKNKFKEMYEDFSENVINIADDDHKKYSAQILDIILDSMGVDTNSLYYNELAEALKKEIAAVRSDMISDDHSNKLYYQSLIERFSRYLYQILITSRYNEDRLREFYDSVDNFYSLSIFYRKPNCKDDLAYINIAPKDQPLCMMLLFHHYLNASDNIRKFTDEISNIAGLRKLPDELSNIIEKAFRVTGGNTGKIIAIITKKFANASNFSDSFRINLLKQILSQAVEKNKPCSVADKESFTTYYKNYHNSLRGGKLYSVDDFKKDFDDDIKILQDVLVNAFVRAVSLEKPFVSIEVKSIDDIIDYIQHNESFRDFVSDNYYKIKDKETKHFDKERRQQEQNATIINAINGMLDTLTN
ncbi:MAG: dynamin family protein [Anaerobutyricum hallii]|uniref:dynamin family protein n=1 Tax=Anaerobutyricum hallii TaxID=39488 RepID=UPI00242B7A27|nr:dynamin family protein [Anaerobutyricum hallii]MDD6587930.1 dynamin family protein [Anaerobutyricum hallii]